MWNSPLLRKTAGMNPVWGIMWVSNTQAHLWCSWTFLLVFLHLSPPLPPPVFSKTTDTTAHALGYRKFNCFILHGKHRPGACGCSSQRTREDEIVGEKNHSWLGNLVQIIMERAACGLNSFLSYFYFSRCTFSSSHHFEIPHITKEKRRAEAGGNVSQWLAEMHTHFVYCDCSWGPATGWIWKLSAKETKHVWRTAWTWVLLYFTL